MRNDLIKYFMAVGYTKVQAEKSADLELKRIKNIVMQKGGFNYEKRF